MKRKYRMTATLLIASAVSMGVAAQDRARDRTRDPATDQDQIRIQDRDQDRVGDRDRIQDRDQDRAQDRPQDRSLDRDQDRARDRDRLHVQDADRLRDRDIYGSDLMTREERREYRERVQAAQSVQEWAQFRAEHQRQMTARARERGVDLPQPFYGQQLLTDQERERLRERLQDAASAQERQRIQAEHREQMQERARQNGIPVDELGS